MKFKVVIDQEFLETTGSGTLLGVIALLSDYQVSEIEHVELFFPQTSIGWRRENGGPESYIIPEFVIPLLLEDILKLQSMNIIVTVTMGER